MPVLKVITRYSEPYQGTYPEKKYHDADSYHDVSAYAIRDEKAEWVGGSAVNPYLAEHEFRLISRLYGKDFGVHLRHFVLSFSNIEKINLEQAKAIAYCIADYYGNRYQILYSIHKDSSYRHIHFVMNTVSYLDGTKFPGTKQEYYQFQAFLKELLGMYGLHLFVASDQPEKK